MGKKPQYFRGRWSFRLMQALSDLKAAARDGLLPALEAMHEGLAGNFFAFLEAPNTPLTDGIPLREAAAELATSPETSAEIRGRAAALLIADSLIEARSEDMLTYLWEVYREELEGLPAPLRAALMNGFKQLHQLNLAKIEPTVSPLYCLSHTLEAVCAPLCAMAKAADGESLLDVSYGDYERDVKKHLAALKHVIHSQDCVFEEGQTWHPHEVVSLATFSPEYPEAQWCLAILLVDSIMGSALDQSIDYRWEKFAHKYMRFPAVNKRYIMAGFRHIYEQDEEWEPYATWSDRQFARDGLVIPPLNA